MSVRHENGMRWLPTPTYLCRKWLALRMLRRLSISKDFLEIGFGAGDFLYELGRRGFSGKGVDLSAEAVSQARSRLKDFAETIVVAKEDFFTIHERFEMVFAFEVLEHYSDDERVLGKIGELLEHGGHLMLSVPAGARRWGPNDEWAGHVRRYEKEELKHKAEKKGFDVVEIFSFGVPIANITKPIYDRLIQRQMRREQKPDDAQVCERSWSTPVARTFQLLFPAIFNRFTLYPFLLLQCLFLNTDLGTGYIALFKKA